MKIKPSIILLLWLSFACSRQQSVEPVATPESIHLNLGNPTNAQPDSVNFANNYLMVKSQYALSYNKSLGHANWVAWELTKVNFGTSDRQDDFRPDTYLPTSWYHVKTSDYTNSGFDRGHLCPSADRTFTLEDNSATFLMTNIIPQAPELNREAWARLEDYCRSLALKDYRLFIIAGTYGTGGEGSKGIATTIKNGINVPAHTYKVIVAVPRGGTAANITTETPVIAVDFPNQSSLVNDKSWSTFITTPSAIEQAAQVTFFTNLKESIRKELRKEKFDPTVTLQAHFTTAP
jgi:endonuclease G, mitochondrial